MGSTTASEHTWFADIRASLGTDQRLFPIPPIPKPGRTTSTCRRARQRSARALGIWSIAECSRKALNLLWGTHNDTEQTHSQGEEAPHSYLGAARPLDTAAHHYPVWHRLLHCSKRVWDGRRQFLGAETGADYIAALCKTLRDSYHATPIDKYTDFQSHLIAEPPLGSPVVHMQEVVSAAAYAHYVDLDSLLRERQLPDKDLQLFNRRFNKVLGERREFVQYLQRREVQDLWALELPCNVRATASIASVAKRSGTMLRKIVMCCPFNEALPSVDDMLGEPAPYGLLGPGALSQVRTSRDFMAFGSADESNAFTAVLAPPSWRFWLGGPRVQVRELDREWVAREEARLGHRLSPSTWVRPCYLRLPMGHTHAVYILLDINFQASKYVINFCNSDCFSCDCSYLFVGLE